MASKKRASGIRKFYEQQTGKKLPSGFDVHHIDFNPENNDILNLLALPSKVHSDYHKNYAPYYLNEKFFMPFSGQPHLTTAPIDF